MNKQAHGAGKFSGRGAKRMQPGGEYIKKGRELERFQGILYSSNVK